MATKLEHCQIHPSPGTSKELSHPLTHFDIPFLQSDPTQRLIFFSFPCSKSHFLETIIPGLKKSLSTTLTHFLPLAGNIILPLKSGTPVYSYVPGDSVSLTVSESNQDFVHLTGNHQRVADEFYTFVPQLPPASRLLDSVVFRVLALQITLFPGQGICIGLSNYHAVADESSMVSFVKTWGLINRLDGEFKKYLPVFGSNQVQDPGELHSRAWNFVKNSRTTLPVELPSPKFPINKIRNTFILTKSQVQHLKNYVFTNNPNLPHISSFTVACAYIWTCSAKSAGEEATVFFAAAADCRRRLSPPVPETYFGNCVVLAIAESRRGEDC